MSNWIEIGRLQDIPRLGSRVVRTASGNIAVFRTESDEVFALDDRCPHKGGPLADGMLAGDQVVCPYHAFRYDSRTGECDQAGRCPVATYPVEVSDGAVHVTVG